MTGSGQRSLFRHQAQGSLIVRDGKVGPAPKLIGQTFAAPGYFQRPAPRRQVTKVTTHRARAGRTWVRPTRTLISHRPAAPERMRSKLIREVAARQVPIDMVDCVPAADSIPRSAPPPAGHPGGARREGSRHRRGRTSVCSSAKAPARRYLGVLGEPGVQCTSSQPCSRQTTCRRKRNKRAPEK